MCLCCLFGTSVIFKPLFKIWSAVFSYSVCAWVLYIRNGKRLHFTKLESYLVKTLSRNSAVKHFQKIPIFNAKPIWIETGHLHRQVISCSSLLYFDGVRDVTERKNSKPWQKINDVQKTLCSGIRNITLKSYPAHERRVHGQTKISQIGKLN